MINSTVLTYTAAYALVATHACSLRCGYCGFRSDTGALLTPTQLSRHLEKARNKDIAEIQIISGENPGRLPHIADALGVLGHRDYIGFIQDLCISILDGGFLPHLNVGVISEEQLAYLRHNLASITIMLENANTNFVENIQPGKTVADRIAGIEAAGRVGLPLSAGMMIGVGESRYSRLLTVDILADIHARYGHIQEVILQAYIPNHQSWIPAHQAQLDDYIEVIKRIESSMPGTAIQVPPVSNPLWLDLVAYGLTDLGSIVFDVSGFNSGSQRIKIRELEEKLTQHDILLAQRLPVYPQYQNERWCSPAVLAAADRILSSRPQRISLVNQLGLFN